MSNKYNSVHLQHPIPDLSKTFEIKCQPSTDVWDKPPAKHSFNAPIIYQTTTVSAFKSAKVTVSADWRHRYDQGGLALIINTQDRRRWIKTGIEMENDQINIGTVGTEKWSDWSLLPIQGNEATIEMEKYKDGALWVSLVNQNGQKTPIREVTWFIDLPGDTECWIGPYAAKPSPNGETEHLVVKFENLVIDA